MFEQASSYDMGNQTIFLLCHSSHLLGRRTPTLNFKLLILQSVDPLEQNKILMKNN